MTARTKKGTAVCVSPFSFSNQTISSLLLKRRAFFFETLVKCRLHIGETQACYFYKRRKTNKGAVHTMQIWQRAYLYVRRKTGKSIPLLLVMLLLFSFVMVGLLLYRAADLAIQQARQTLLFFPRGTILRRYKGGLPCGNAPTLQTASWR